MLLVLQEIIMEMINQGELLYLFAPLEVPLHSFFYQIVSVPVDYKAS